MEFGDFDLGKNWSFGSVPTCRTCLQHSNFIHHDIEGDSLEECQVSAARIAAKRAYGEAGRGGEEVQTQQKKMMPLFHYHYCYYYYLLYYYYYCYYYFCYYYLLYYYMYTNYTYYYSM